MNFEGHQIIFFPISLLNDRFYLMNRKRGKMEEEILLKHQHNNNEMQMFSSNKKKSDFL